MSDDRYVCTAEAPWTPDKGRRAEHPDAKHEDGLSDYYDYYHCPNCDKHFKVELPE